jgi:hypothetical protein
VYQYPGSRSIVSTMRPVRIGILQRMFSPGLRTTRFTTVCSDPMTSSRVCGTPAATSNQTESSSQKLLGSDSASRATRCRNHLLLRTVDAQAEEQEMSPGLEVDRDRHEFRSSRGGLRAREARRTRCQGRNPEDEVRTSEQGHGDEEQKYARDDGSPSGTHSTGRSRSHLSVSGRREHDARGSRGAAPQDVPEGHSLGSSSRVSNQGMCSSKKA